MAISRGLPGLTLEEMMNLLKEDTQGEPLGPAERLSQQLPPQSDTAQPFVGIDLDSTADWVEVEITPDI